MADRTTLGYSGNGPEVMDLLSLLSRFWEGLISLAVKQYHCRVTLLGLKVWEHVLLGLAIQVSRVFGNL